MKETLYGRNTVLEALRANRRQFFQIALSDGIRPNDVVSRIFSTCQKRGIRMERMSRRKLDEICGHDRHQGVLASVSSYPDVEIEDILSSLEASSDP